MFRRRQPKDLGLNYLSILREHSDHPMNLKNHGHLSPTLSSSVFFTMFDLTAFSLPNNLFAIRASLDMGAPYLSLFENSSSTAAQETLTDTSGNHVDCSDGPGRPAATNRLDSINNSPVPSIQAALQTLTENGGYGVSKLVYMCF